MFVEQTNSFQRPYPLTRNATFDGQKLLRPGSYEKKLSLKNFFAGSAYLQTR